MLYKYFINFMVGSIFNNHHTSITIQEYSGLRTFLETSYQDVFIEKQSQFLILTKEVNENIEVVIKDMQNIRKITINNNKNLNYGT